VNGNITDWWGTISTQSSRLDAHASSHPVSSVTEDLVCDMQAISCHPIRLWPSNSQINPPFVLGLLQN